jgi:hypothetical protein
MKNPVTKWVIVVILVLVMGYSGFATYNWLEREKMRNYALSDVVYFADDSVVELTDMGSVAEYWIEPDTTDELVMGGALGYWRDARTLRYASGMLRDLTNDEKYRLFETAMHNLEGFFVEVNNRSDRKEILTTNLDVLSQMGDILEETLPIDNLTLVDAENLLELAGNLTTS